MKSSANLWLNMLFVHYLCLCTTISYFRPIVMEEYGCCKSWDYRGKRPYVRTFSSMQQQLLHNAVAFLECLQ